MPPCLRLLVTVLALLGLGWPPAAAAAPGLVLGVIEDGAGAGDDEAAALAAYLAPHLAGRGGGDKVTVRRAPSVPALAEAMAAGRIDLFAAGPVVAALVARRAEARFMLRGWKDGAAEYRTLVVARADSGLRSLDQLAGRVVAFWQVDSTPGHLLPRADLVARGYRVAELAAPGAAVAPGTIGYAFAHGDLSGLAWLLRGRVAATVVRDGALARPGLERVRAQLVELARSPALPRQVLIRGRGLDGPAAGLLEAALVRMHEDPAGRRALRLLDGVERLEPFPEGAAAAQARVEALLAAVGTLPPQGDS
jgi:phosphonate transport system substrate-binding protein